MNDSPHAQLLKDAVEFAPAGIKTVARLFDEDPSASYVPAEDLEDGTARCAGWEPGQGQQRIQYPALLFYERGIGRGTVALVWHRDDGTLSEHGGARVSKRTQDACTQAFLDFVHAMDASSVFTAFRVSGETSFSYENAYQAISVIAAYRWDPCVLPFDANLRDAYNHTPNFY